MDNPYVSMWQDLGLDLAAHDALLDVLGRAYADFFLTQKNRPEGMGYFDFVMIDGTLRPARRSTASRTASAAARRRSSAARADDRQDASIRPEECAASFLSVPRVKSAV